MKTAIQELIDKHEHSTRNDVVRIVLHKEQLKELLEAEKQQIIDAYDEGVTYYEHDSLGLSAEEYFTKTYKQ